MRSAPLSRLAAALLLLLLTTVASGCGAKDAPPPATNPAHAASLLEAAGWQIISRDHGDHGCVEATMGGEQAKVCFERCMGKPAAAVEAIEGERFVYAVGDPQRCSAFVAITGPTTLRSIVGGAGT